MALDSYHHGVRVIEVIDGLRSIQTVSTAIIGLIGTASDADADEATFPYDMPALVTNVNAAVGKAGTKETLAAILDAINLQATPVIVVVRVRDGDGATAVGTTPTKLRRVAPSCGNDDAETGVISEF